MWDLNSSESYSAGDVNNDVFVPLFDSICKHTLLRPNNKYGVQANFMKISERKKKYLTNSISQFIFIFILSLKLNWALKSLSLTYIAKSGLIKTYDICCYFYFWWLIRCILFIFYLPYLLIFLYIILSVRYCMWIDKNKKKLIFLFKLS